MKTFDQLHTDRTHAAYAIVGHAEMIMQVHDLKQEIIEPEWDGLRAALQSYEDADKAMERFWTPKVCEFLHVQNCEDRNGQLCGKNCEPGQYLCPEHLAEVGE